MAAAATTVEQNSIPIEAFLACFPQWRKRWQKYVESQEDYFVGDQVYNAPGGPFFFRQGSDTFLMDLVFFGHGLFLGVAYSIVLTPQILVLNMSSFKCQKVPSVFFGRCFFLGVTYSIVLSPQVPVLNRITEQKQCSIKI